MEDSREHSARNEIRELVLVAVLIALLLLSVL